MANAVVFPGLGSQQSGMAKDFCACFAASREVFAEASDALDLDLKAICFRDDVRLDHPEYAQPALLTAELAMFRSLERELGFTAAWFGGRGLGEVTALCAAGALPLTAAVRLVRTSGRLLDGPPGSIEGRFRADLLAAAPSFDVTKAAAVTSNATGGFHAATAEALVDALVRQLRGPADWPANVAALAGWAKRIFEVGPRRTLHDSFKAAGRDVTSITTERQAVAAFVAFCPPLAAESLKAAIGR